MLVDLIHKQHLELGELFMQHQEALVQARFDDAVAAMARFNTCLSAHMVLEEKYLFPEFALIKRRTRWDVELYEMEHGKIRKLCDSLVKDLHWLRDQGLQGSDLYRNIIALLDREKTFKGMLEHHEDREEDAMLRELDTALSGQHLHELKDGINAVWKEALESTTG